MFSLSNRFVLRCFVILQVRIWLEEILWDKKHDMDVYHCKGVLSVVNSDELHTIQAVREIYEILPARKWKNGKTQTNKIVFIGRSLKEDILLESVKDCFCSRLQRDSSRGSDSWK